MYLLAPGPFGLGGWELLIIAFIIVLVFGVGRLPEVGGAVGKGLREFRKSARDDVDDAEVHASADPPAMTSVSAAASPASTLNSVPPQPAAAAPPPDAQAPAASADTRFCSECGTRNLRSAKFCAQCGTAMAALTQ